MDKAINPHQMPQRQLLRFFGLLLAGFGMMFTAIGLISFFSSFGTFEPPQYFWCAFIGLPMVGIGITLLKFSFLGTISRYIAGEYAPVAKDTFNYLGRETTEGMTNISRALGTGLREGMQPVQEQREDVADRLKKLDDLRRQGLINEAEHDAQRKRILEDV